MPCAELAKNNQPLLLPPGSSSGNLGLRRGDHQIPMPEPQPQGGWEGTAIPEHPLCTKHLCLPPLPPSQQAATAPLYRGGTRLRTVE